MRSFNLVCYISLHTLFIFIKCTKWQSMTVCETNSILFHRIIHSSETYFIKPCWSPQHVSFGSDHPPMVQSSWLSLSQLCLWSLYPILSIRCSRARPIKLMGRDCKLIKSKSGFSGPQRTDTSDELWKILQCNLHWHITTSWSDTAAVGRFIKSTCVLISDRLLIGFCDVFH